MRGRNTEKDLLASVNKHLVTLDGKKQTEKLLKNDPITQHAIKEIYLNFILTWNRVFFNEAT